MSGWSLSDLLPGLYFLALAAGLTAALHRWFDPLPPRLATVFALLVSILFASSLFGGWVLLPLGNLKGAVPFRDLPSLPRGNWLQGDLIHQITPWLLEVRRAVFDGRWPLWNARSGAGMPLLSDPQSQAFQPLVVAAYLLPIRQAVAVTSALRVFVALAFMFLFLRRLRLGAAAATCGALAYGLGGFVLLWLGWPIGNGAALLPALLYAVTRLDEEGRRRDSVLLCAVTAAVLLAGHPETQLYELVCAGSFLLARSIARPAWRDRRAILLRSGWAMGLAALAMAPVLLPIAEYLPTSHRATLVRNHLAPQPLGPAIAALAQPAVRAAWAKEARERILPVAAPRAFGDLEESWGSENFIEDTSGCAGAAALCAALIALVPLRWSGGTRFPQERFAAGILLVSLALLAQPPGFDVLFGRLPVLGATAIHHHHRVLLLVNLATAWLAAGTVERWTQGLLRRSVVIGVGAALAALIAWAYVAHPSPETGRVVYGL
ncbi:MAG TPA: YfhO family protein, partial [Thermoanaerobaculia bacterium]